MSSHDEDGLDGPHAEVVVVLLGQLLAGQVVEVDDLVGQRLGLDEALGEQHDLGDEGVVRHHHGHRAEQRLEVVGQLHSTCIPAVHKAHYTSI